MTHVLLGAARLWEIYPPPPVSSPAPSIRLQGSKSGLTSVNSNAFK